jgi:hypothetical protein
MRTALVVVTALLLSASAATAALSPSEYKKRGEALCQGGEDSLDKLAEPKTNAQFVVFFRKVVKIADGVVEGVAGLSPPKARVAAHREMTVTTRRVLGLYRGVLKQLEAGGNPQKIITGADAKLTAATTTANAAYVRAGLPGCAN